MKSVKYLINYYPNYGRLWKSLPFKAFPIIIIQREERFVTAKYPLNRFLFLMIGLLVTSLLVACSGERSATTPANQPATSPAATATREPLEAAAKSTPDQAAGHPPQGAEGEAYPAPQGGSLVTPASSYPEPDTGSSPESDEVRTELMATDPNSVELAAGRVQLVEFFAFW
jgi:hypothetical protein